MHFLHITHPKRAGLARRGVTHRDHAIGLKGFKVNPGLAGQASGVVATLLQETECQWVHRIHRRAPRARRSQNTPGTLIGDGLTEDASASIMSAYEQQFHARLPRRAQQRKLRRLV